MRRSARDAKLAKRKGVKRKKKEARYDSVMLLPHPASRQKPSVLQGGCVGMSVSRSALLSPARLLSAVESSFLGGGIAHLQFLVLADADRLLDTNTDIRQGGQRSSRQIRELVCARMVVQLPRLPHNVRVRVTFPVSWLLMNPMACATVDDGESQYSA
jgi:hypothetical protein